MAQITRIATAQAVGVAVTRAAALRVNDHFVPAAADRFADQAMIVALAITRRCVEQIDAEIERAADRGDRLGILGRSIGARHAVTAETDGRHHEIGIAKASAFHGRASCFKA